MITSPAARSRVALYGHDTLGLGHVRRNLALAQAISEDRPGAPGADVLVVSGTSQIGLFDRPAGVDTLVLPGIRKGDDGRYGARSLRTHLDDVVDLRATTLQAALRSFAPDVLVVDKSPWGFQGELAGVLPLLKAAGTRLVLGLRDVLDEPAATAREWRHDDGDAAVSRLYDEVWVYGDARVHDVTAACGMSRAAAARTHHLGYLSKGRMRDSATAATDSTGAAVESDPAEGTDRRGGPVGDEPYVLVTVGGGQDGAALVEAAADVTLRDDTHVVILAGPQTPEARLRALRARTRRRDGVHVMRFRRRAAPWASQAQAVVTMGGANTVAEILAGDVPALVVPRVHPRREQLVRAQALAHHGALDVLLPEEVTAQRLTGWINRARGRRVDRTHLDLDGLSQVRDRMHRLLDRPHPGRITDLSTRAGRFADLHVATTKGAVDVAV